MATGDLTCSTVTYVDNTASAIATQVNTLNLAAATDFLYIIPMHNSQKVAIFKVARAA